MKAHTPSNIILRAILSRFFILICRVWEIFALNYTFYTRNKAISNSQMYSVFGFWFIEWNRSRGYTAHTSWSYRAQTRYWLTKVITWTRCHTADHAHSATVSMPKWPNKLCVKTMSALPYLRWWRRRRRPSMTNSFSLSLCLFGIIHLIEITASFSSVGFLSFTMSSSISPSNFRTAQYQIAIFVPLVNAIIASRIDRVNPAVHNDSTINPFFACKIRL